MVQCANHPMVAARYDGLCQPCLDARKAQQRAAANPAAVPATVQPPMTPEAILGRYGAILRQKDANKGYYLVNGEIGMHVHVYGSDYGMHIKVGNDKFAFFNVKGKFMPDAWREGVAAVHRRAVGPDHNRLLAAMGMMLMERGTDLTREEIQNLIAALPFNP